MVESTPLLKVRASKGHRGFESLPVRHRFSSGPPSGGPFSFRRESTFGEALVLADDLQIESPLLQRARRQLHSFVPVSTGKMDLRHGIQIGRLARIPVEGFLQIALGFIQAPRYRLEPYFESGELVEALPKYPPPPMPIAVMYPHHRQLAPRVRVFIDWVVERLAPFAAA